MSWLNDALKDDKDEEDKKGKSGKREEETVQATQEIQEKKESPQKVRSSEELADAITEVWEFILNSEILLLSDYGDDIPDSFFEEYAVLRDKHLSESVMKQFPVSLKQVETVIFGGKDDKSG